MSVTAGRKATDGQSVRVTVPDTVTCLQGEFALLDGWFGLNATMAKDVAAGAAQVVLQIEEAEYETDQITTAEAYPIGALVNFNGTTKLFTVAAVAGAIVGPVGRITVAKDVNNVIWFKLFTQRRA